MAVVCGKRHRASTEFENTFADLYSFTIRQTSAVPKRRRRWVCLPLEDGMNLMYRDIMHINELWITKHADKVKDTGFRAKRTIEMLNRMEKPLIVLWASQRTKTKTMATWVSLIRKEISLLNSLHPDDDIDCTVSILDLLSVNSMEFMKNMVNLHRYVHSKVVNSPTRYADNIGAQLISLVNDALYELVLANKIFPESRVDYELRRSHISKAITCLHEMNRPLVSYFSLMNYSDRVMCEWAELLSLQLKLLNGLNKSDNSRFSSL